MAEKTKKADEISEYNYYDSEMNWKYMSASQYKSIQKCPAAAMAELKGEYTSSYGSGITFGKLMDAKFDGPAAMDRLMLSNRPDYFKKNGEPRADTIKCMAAYDRASRDPVFMDYMSGDHQTIMTAELPEIPGIDWKIKMDSYFPGDKIVDLKYMANMDSQYVNGERKTFIDAWRYDIQLSIYQRVEAVASGTGELLPCYIAVITKETTPQIDVIELPQWYLDSAYEEIKHYAPIFQEYKDGKEPPRCEHCDYCRETKIIEKPMTYEELLTA